MEAVQNVLDAGEARAGTAQVDGTAPRQDREPLGEPGDGCLSIPSGQDIEQTSKRVQSVEHV